jgi:hypothetical protein
MKKLIVLVCLLFVASALAEDVGTITIYRLADHVRGWKPVVTCDGQRVAAVQGGKYVKINVSAGKHTFSASNSKNSVDVDVKPAGDYYIRMTAISLGGGGTFDIADPSQARSQLIRMEPLSVTEVSGGVCRNRGE